MICDFEKVSLAPQLHKPPDERKTYVKKIAE
jgi:hypothetical protein